MAIAQKTRSPLEARFAILWSDRHPDIELFHDFTLGLVGLDGRKRRYRADFVEPQTKTAIEIQGGIYMRSRTGHSSAKGVKRDCHKFSLAVLRGWRLFILEPLMVDVEWMDAIYSSIKNETKLREPRRD